MKTAGMVFVICFAAMVTMAQGESVDALLNLLDEAIETVADVNGLPQAAQIAAESVEPNLPAVIEPNRLPITPEPTPLMGEDKNIAPTAVAAATLPEESRKLRQAFLKGQIEPVARLSSQEQETNLIRLIEQLNHLEAPKKLVSETSPETGEIPLDQSPETVAQVEETGSELIGADPIFAETKSDPNTAGSQMLARLEQAESVVNPLLLADALFRQGHAQQAFGYYQKAAEQLPQEAVESQQWAMFQMANCSVDTDPAKAKDLYTDLLSRFPNSSWSGLAKSRLAVLEWTMSEPVQRYIRTGEHAQR